MTYLLSCHGTIVCRNTATGEVTHRSLTEPLGDAEPLDIGEATAALQIDVGNFVRDDIFALRLTLEAGPLAGWTVIRSPDVQALLIVRDGQYMTAPGDRKALVLVAAPVLDSAFVALGSEDLAVLRGMLSIQWLTDAEGDAAPATMAPEFGVRVGKTTYDLRFNLPFDRTDWPNRLTLHCDIWRIRQIYRYRPLVYFVAFGDDRVMRQFALSLTSLVTVGQYDGAIVVITDKTSEEIRALLPGGIKATVALLPTQAHDTVGYKTARYGIVQWPGAWDYQPLLYVDADILFDRPVAPMLHDIARADRVCAPAEPHFLASSPFLGSNLLLDDGCLPSPDKHGFNSGTLGIPNMVRHARTMALIGRTVRNRLAVVGRHSVQFVDQPIANYVSYRAARIDTELLSRYVRLADAEATPDQRRGLVHYCWVPNADVRVEVMTKYLEHLRGMADIA